MLATCRRPTKKFSAPSGKDRSTIASPRLRAHAGMGGRCCGGGTTALSWPVSLRPVTPGQAIYERALEIDKQDALQRQVELESKRLEAASGHGAQRDDAAVDGASTHADGEASGSGDSFKVGVFDPTKIDAP